MGLHYIAEFNCRIILIPIVVRVELNDFSCEPCHISTHLLKFLCVANAWPLRVHAVRMCDFTAIGMHWAGIACPLHIDHHVLPSQNCPQPEQTKAGADVYRLLARIDEVRACLCQEMQQLRFIYYPSKSNKMIGCNITWPATSETA